MELASYAYYFDTLLEEMTKTMNISDRIAKTLTGYLQNLKLDILIYCDVFLTSSLVING
jgi:hypothetical protein